MDKYEHQDRAATLESKATKLVAENKAAHDRIRFECEGRLRAEAEVERLRTALIFVLDDLRSRGTDPSLARHISEALGPVPPSVWTDEPPTIGWHWFLQHNSIGPMLTYVGENRDGVRYAAIENSGSGVALHLMRGQWQRCEGPRP